MAGEVGYVPVSTNDSRGIFVGKLTYAHTSYAGGERCNASRLYSPALTSILSKHILPLCRERGGHLHGQRSREARFSRQRTSRATNRLIDFHSPDDIQRFHFVPAYCSVHLGAGGVGDCSSIVRRAKMLIVAFFDEYSSLNFCMHCG